MSTATATADTSLLGGDGPLVRAYRWVRTNPWVSLLGAPVAIAALSLLLYMWVTTQDLGSIETDALRAELIRGQLLEHLQLTGVSTVFVIAIAIPLGIFVTRPSARRLSTLIQGVASSGQAIPAYGLLVLLAITFGTNFRSAVIALIVYSILPVLRNTMVGLQQVDTSTIEAARGMGMTSSRSSGRSSFRWRCPSSWPASARRWSSTSGPPRLRSSSVVVGSARPSTPA